MAVIYLVDDEENIRHSISYALGAKHQITCFDSAEQAQEMVRTSPPEVLLLDVGLPGLSGLDFLQSLDNPPPTIILTAYDDLQTVIAAMKRGAADYLIKPIQLPELILAIDRVLETSRLRGEVRALQTQNINEDMPFIVGSSDAISHTMTIVEKAAQSQDTPILISGESGVGKELIARAIHYYSPNRRGNFVAVNCAAIPASLLESELFGYAGGAFSGANKQGRNGLVEEAAGGSLFLDEIGDMPFDLQAKLLRFIESGEFYRLGDAKKRQVSTRIISASHQDLMKMVGENSFRLDLFYRLAVILIHIPSLNERPEDVLLIAQHFLAEFSKKYQKKITGFKPEAISWLKEHHWVGNIRELRNLIERGVLLNSGGLFDLNDVGPVLNPGQYFAEKINSLTDLSELKLPADGLDFLALEKKLIKEAYERAKKNDRQAASLLHMSYYAFRYRRKQILPD